MESKPFTLEEKWKIDSEQYNNPNYKAETGEIQCYKCINRIKGNSLKCSKYDNIPENIIFDKEKCEYRKVENNTQE